MLPNEYKTRKRKHFPLQKWLQTNKNSVQIITAFVGKFLSLWPATRQITDNLNEWYEETGSVKCRQRWPRFLMTEENLLMVDSPSKWMRRQLQCTCSVMMQPSGSDIYLAFKALQTYTVTSFKWTICWQTDKQTGLCYNKSSNTVLSNSWPLTFSMVLQ
jgi:hypothetical protein